MCLGLAEQYEQLEQLDRELSRAQDDLLAAHLKLAGPNAPRSSGFNGSSAAAAHRCGASTYGFPGSSTLASRGRPKTASGWLTR